MRILVFSHYFPPEVNAPAARTYDHAVRWARAGHDVTVVTCVPNCPRGVVFGGYRNTFRRQVEDRDGIRVVRVWTYLAPNAGTVRRILNYVSYLASAVLASLRLDRPDVIVATSPQFFCGWAGVWASRLKGCPFVLEVRDIWPESIAAVGALRNRPLLRFLEWLERRMYRAADHIVTVGEGYRERISAKIESTDRVSVITNGVDLEQFVPEQPDPRFLHMWDLENKFVCSYIGTIGMAHGLDVVIDAAERLKVKGRDDIRFCLVGDGASRRRLEDEAKRRGIDDLVMFTGLQPRVAIPSILASSHACLIHLKSCELFGTVIPSKVFETMAMGCPIIMGVRGEAQRIVMDAEAGLSMDPGSPDSLVHCVETLADEPALRAQLGVSARDYVSERYDRDRLADAYLQLLHRVTGSTPKQRVSFSRRDEDEISDTLAAELPAGRSG